MDRIQIISPNGAEFRKILERNGIRVNPEILSSTRRVHEFICSNRQIMHNLNLLIVTLSSHGVAVVS
ncbi:hypothetical protein NECAME_10929, partial [Necator americanus]